MESYNFFVSGSRQKSRTRTGPGFSALFSRHNFHHTNGNRNRGRELLAFMRCKRFLPWLAAPAAAKKSDKPGKSDTDSAKNAPDQPKWDPLRAEKDIEVAEHYMHIGDYDAAIDRLEDAIDSKPGYAIPFRYLGEAQEKKGLKKQAVKSYQRYLDLYPHAEDAAKIKKKIEKLYKEVAKEKKN